MIWFCTIRALLSCASLRTVSGEQVRSPVAGTCSVEEVFAQTEVADVGRHLTEAFLEMEC